MAEQLTIREDLFCPECASQGMKPMKAKSEAGKTRYKCGQCSLVTTKTIYTQPQVLPKVRITDIKKHKRFLITSAVNDTDLVTEWFKTLKRMAEELDACLIVIPGVYKNPDLKHQGVISGYTWPEEVLPYMCNVDVPINKSLTIKGKTRIQYTVINPLAGMNHAGGIASEIYGHPQVAMQMVPTAKTELPKMLLTTGTISQPNYGGSQRAQKAEFHHSLSATFIEVEGNCFWPTQVHFDGEGAQLFDRYYHHRGSRKANKSAAIVFGDTHKRSMTVKTEASLDAVAKALNPDHQIYHDLHDHHISSHHNEKNILFKIEKNATKEFSVRDELMMSAKFLENKKNAVVVDSNHHRHLDQWFNRGAAHDPVNVDLYFELGWMACQDKAAGGDGNLFRLFLEQYCSNEVRFVDGDEAFIVAGIDCSQHGDVGPNGARGSAKAFSKTGHKTVIGHSHTPGIEKGCYQVGTSALALAYAVGYTSWMNTHCIIYPNGKRGLFNIVNEKLSPLMRLL